MKLLLAFGAAAAATMAFLVACDDDCSSTASCNGEVSNVPNEDAGPTIDAISPESGQPDVPSVEVEIGVPSMRFVVQGAKASLPVSIERPATFTGDVILELTGPEKMTIPAITIPSDQTTAIVTVEAASDCAQGKTAVAVTARSTATDVVVHGEAAIPLFVRGPSGAVDTTFGGGMISGTFKDIGALAARADAVTTPEGKVLVVGYSTDGWKLVRFNEDGEIDTSFGASGVASIPDGIHLPSGADSLHLSLDTSHRILVSGSTIVRFTADGKLDKTWNTTGIVPHTFPNDAATYSIVRDGPLGTYLVAERCPAFQCEGEMRLTRLTASGSPDPDFGVSGSITVRSKSDSPGYRHEGIPTVMADGKIVLTYLIFASYGVDVESLATAMSVVTSDGRQKTTTVLGDVEYKSQQALTSGGEIIVVTLHDEPTTTLRLRRMKPDLTLSSGFGTGGIVDVDSISHDSLWVPSDDSIFLSGPKAGNAVVARFTSSGTPDTAFGPAGRVSLSMSEATVRKTSFQSDGHFIVIGTGTDDGSRIVRYWL